MLDRLNQVRLASLQNDPFRGNSKRRRYREQLFTLPKDAAAISRIHLLVEIAQSELIDGFNRDAIKYLQQAMDLLNATNESNKIDPAQFNEAHTKLVQDLGVAWLRVAETENCVHCKTGASCILPIQSDGIHIRQEGAEEAIKLFTELLNKDAENYQARWLLNIASMAIGQYPHGVPEQWRIPVDAFASKSAVPHFENVSARMGLNVVDLAGGAIVEDFDNDGYPDIVTSTWDTSGGMHYFKNDGHGNFTERTKDAGLDGLLGGLNMIQADYNNDGLTDIYVLRGAWKEEQGHVPNSLLKNLGGGCFRDVTFDVGLAEPAMPTLSAAWSDFDGDGDLDLFVGGETFPSQLFEQQKNGRFVDIAATAGVTNDRYVRGTAWGDYDGDGRPDLYVSNLQGRNRLYHNEGHGRFTDVAQQLGVAGPINSFATWFWDSNNDGHLDIFVASYDGSVDDVAKEILGHKTDCEVPALYLGNGNGGFTNVASEYGLDRVVLAMGANFGDIDNDGFSDMYLGTGRPNYAEIIPNLLFRNAAGSGFEDVTFAAGMGHLQKGHGVSFADVDLDGDEDVFIQLGGAYPGDAFANALFRNPGSGANWLSVRLVGEQTNRSAIGARIRAVIQDGDQVRSVYSYVNSGGSFGANPLRSHLGLGSATTIELLEIHWPTTGRTQSFLNVDANQFLEIREGIDKIQSRPQRWPPDRFTNNSSRKAISEIISSL